MEILKVNDLKKIYTTRFGGNQVQALKGVTFSVESGEYVAIMGESGSGKTTLLNLLAALDKPTSGKVILDGKELSSVKERTLASFRRENLGFVFQEFNLIDTFSLKDNILLPLVLSGISVGEMEKRLEPDFFVTFAFCIRYIVLPNRAYTDRDTMSEMRYANTKILIVTRYPLLQG